MNAEEQWRENYRAENLQTKIRRLERLIELLQTEVALASTGGVEQPNFEFGHRIFLVHGRDEGVLHEVARFLE
jgi:hypothetical protein